MSTLNNACPKCGAPAGMSCRTIAGTILAESHSHVARLMSTAEPTPATREHYLRMAEADNARRKLGHSISTGTAR